MGRVSVDPKKITMQETNNRKEDISTGETYLTLKKQLFVFPAKASAKSTARASLATNRQNLPALYEFF